MSYGYTYNLTQQVANTLGYFVIIVVAICAVFYFVSATILLAKLNSFAGLHSSSREEMLHKYRILAICILTVGAAAVIIVCFTSVLVAPTYLEDPVTYVVATAINMISQLLFNSAVLVMTQPKMAGESTGRSKTDKNHSASSNSEKQKFSVSEKDIEATISMTEMNN